MRIRRRKRYQTIEPDEILIDAQNLPAFDTTRLEGKIERPIEARAFRTFILLASLIGIIFIGQLVNLQVVQGTTFAKRAEANRLDSSVIIATRGAITDRTGVPLAENKPDETLGYATRVYPLGAAAAHLIGYVSYPKRDQNGHWWEDTSKGLAGVEASFNDTLAGVNGARIEETDATGQAVSGSVVRAPADGTTLVLSIDAGLQEELYRVIKDRADQSSFVGGSGVIMDVDTGEVLAITSYPSFNPETVSNGGSGGEVASLLSDPRAPFLDRAISGLYSPGSVVKPFVAVGALEEGVITPEKQILSTGSISVPNPYDPTHPSIFKDWREQGWVDMRHAIAYSSDVYFYEVGGGFQDQRGLGIAAVEKYLRLFGIAEPTGINLPNESGGTIPNPAWKALVFDGERWLLGDTYHTAIGQYGFQVTPLELVRATAALANGGTLVTPALLKGQQGARERVDVSPVNLEVAREGMRLAVTDSLGTAKALAIPGLAVGAKTGTAQVGVRNEYTNSVVIGFFPYEHPRYAFAVIMERARAGTSGAPATMGDVLSWIVVNRPGMLE